MRCTSCLRDNPSDAAYCSGCGSRLAARGESHDRPGLPGIILGDPEPADRLGRLAPAADVPAADAPAAPTTLPKPSPAAPGTLAGGRYVLGALLGEGATKRVYLGRDQRLDREVAIARIDVAALDESGRLRVEREAQAMARLGDHPNIVTVHDVLEEAGALYIVTQHMAQGDLARRIAASPGGRLPVDDAVAIAIQICRALEHAHGRGVIHRDLKPANVWLAADGTAKLGDFGLALAIDRTRLTAEGMIVGTVAYMPPEQALGGPRDARSDLYALGATLYEMVTGRPPFTGDDIVAVFSQHIHTPPVAPGWLNPSIPKPLDRLILDLLAKDPAARPTGAAAVRGRLQGLAGSPLPSTTASAQTAVVNPLDRLAGGVFVGRSVEVERLRASFEDALSGRVRILLVSGEPGIGKTRIAEELTTYARMRGADVLWGRCHDGPGAPPFWPWVQVVRGWLLDREPREILADLGPGASDLATIVSELHDVLPGLSEPPRLDPEQARLRLFESLTTTLRNASRRRPLVVVLDDLHWADEASLQLLQFLAREIGPSRLLFVGTYRDVELRRGHPLSETLAELARERATERIPLHGLSAEDVERFLLDTTGAPPPRGLPESIHRETEGNPFFVHEVVRLLASEGKLTRSTREASWSHEIPQGVKEVIGRRLNKLSATCNEVLATAAVLGRDFELAVLARVSGKPEIALLEALEEAVAARLLAEVRESAGRYRFPHALVRETLYDELSAPRRVRLHRAAGEVLDRLSGEIEGPRLAEVAHHFFQSVEAGDPERTIAACERAAEWARSRQAWEDAALHLERAVQVLEMAERPDQRRLADLLVTLAERQALGRDPEKTRRTAQRAAELAREIGPPPNLARAALAYGAHLNIIELGRVDAEMVALLQEALDALGDDQPSLRASLLHRLAQELSFSSDHDRVVTLLEEGQRLAEQAGDPALEARVALGFLFNARLGVQDETAAAGERLVELARRGRDPAVEQGAWNQVAVGSLWLCRVDAAKRALLELQRLAGELRTPFGRYVPLGMGAAIAILEGRFDDAISLVREGRQVLGGAAGATNMAQMAGTRLYLVARLQGTPMSPEQTLALVGRFLAYNIYRAILCGVYLSAGDRNAALRELGILATDDFRRVSRDGNWLATLVLAADHASDLGEPRYADALYSQLQPFAGRCPGVGPMIVCLGPTDLRLGRLAMLLGRREEAETHLRDAIEIASRMGARPFLAESRVALAALLARRAGEGDRESALREIDAALDIARDIGMVALVEKALASKIEVQGLVDARDGRTLSLDPADR